MRTGFMVGWRQVVSCFILLGAIAMITSAYSVVVVPIGEEFGPSRMVLMLGMTVVTAVSAVLAPPLGFLMDRFSIRFLMVLGAVTLATGFAALSFATSFVQVLIVYGLLIAPANVLMGPTAATVLLSRWFVRRRGTAIGIALAGISMGGVIYPPLIQWLLDTYHWREALRWFAVILAFVVLTAALLVVSAPAERGLHADGDKTESETARNEAQATPVSATAILKDPAFWLIASLFAIMGAGMIGMVTNLAPLAIDQGIAPRDAALLISIYASAGFIAKLGFAAIADRLKLRTLTMLTVGGFAAGMACLTQAHVGYWVIALGVILIGLFGGLMVPLKSLIVPLVFGRQVIGRAMGMMSTISLGIAVATPPAFGLVFDLTGSYAGMLAVFAAVAALAILAVPYIRMTAKVPVPG